MDHAIPLSVIAGLTGAFLGRMTAPRHYTADVEVLRPATIRITGALRDVAIDDTPIPAPAGGWPTVVELTTEAKVEGVGSRLRFVPRFFDDDPARITIDQVRRAALGSVVVEQRRLSLGFTSGFTVRFVGGQVPCRAVIDIETLHTEGVATPILTVD